MGKKEKPIKIRREWEIDPCTRIKKNDKSYNRAKLKQQDYYDDLENGEFYDYEEAEEEKENE